MQFVNIQAKQSRTFLCQWGEKCFIKKKVHLQNFQPTANHLLWPMNLKKLLLLLHLRLMIGRRWEEKYTQLNVQTKRYSTHHITWLRQEATTAKSRRKFTQLLNGFLLSDALEDSEEQVEVLLEVSRTWSIIYPETNIHGENRGNIANRK